MFGQARRGACCFRLLSKAQAMGAMDEVKQRGTEVEESQRERTYNSNHGHQAEKNLDTIGHETG